MSAAVHRRDIALVQDDEPRVWLYEGFVGHRWTATLHGSLSSGECARLSRAGRSANEALLALEEGIAAAGWEIEGGFTPPPPRPPFDLDKAWRDNAALADEIRTLRGTIA